MLFLFIALISLLLQLFLPWWIISPIAFGLCTWRATTGKHAFYSSFGAIFILWIAAALLKTLPNENLLANRVGQMLQLPAWQFDWVIVLCITGIIGGLTAGFAGLAGFYVRQTVK